MSSKQKCHRCGASFAGDGDSRGQSFKGGALRLSASASAVLGAMYEGELCPDCRLATSAYGEAEGMEREAEELALFGELVYLMRRLRRDCPWDAKQTVESLRQYTIEEVHELADAIVDHSDVNIRKELGDLIMHVVFYALIGEEHGRFSLAEMLKGENEKLIYRHPHVFGDNPSTDADEVERQWEALKLKEKGGNRRVLEGVPRSLPALVKAMRIQEKAAAAGFDWTMREDVWGKVEEELAETREAVMEEDIPHMQEEFGDLLFAVINAARLYDVDPAFALEEANRKFMRRFNHVETRTLESGRQLADMSLDEMEAFWCEAKRIERGEQ